MDVNTDAQTWLRELDHVCASVYINLYMQRKHIERKAL